MTLTNEGAALVPALSVVICSLNGAAGVDRCIRALEKQTIYSQLEIIVSDDGSTDDTSEVAKAHGAIVTRNHLNRGVSAARNSGVLAASAPILAFVDDDCEPEPQWAEYVLSSYRENVFAVGGSLLVRGKSSMLLGYLSRHNPLEPQELVLAKSDRLPYRLYLYLRRQWKSPAPQGTREIFSCASANMSVRRQEFLDVGGFDERFRFGSEDEDLCRRLRREFAAERLIFRPEARVDHFFKASISDTLRRRRAYGRGSAQLYRKWPNVRPTFFPGPILILLTLFFSIHITALLVVAVLLPYLFYPLALRLDVVRIHPRSLLDPYLQLAEEASHDVGFLEGLWRFRKLTPEPPCNVITDTAAQKKIELVP